MNIATIAIIPYRMGMELSAMGMQASSAITRLITNSKGCISPIWLLPISRITSNSTTNIMVVRMKIRAIKRVLAK